MKEINEFVFPLAVDRELGSDSESHISTQSISILQLALDSCLQLTVIGATDDIRFSPAALVDLGRLRAVPLVIM
jgi:hypothetical protein